MAKYYVQLDEKRYITKVQSDPAEGFLGIYVPTQQDEVFGETWDKWGVNELGTPIHGWLPPITREDFNKQADALKTDLDTANATIDSQKEIIDQQGKSIASLQTDNGSLKQLAAGLTMQVAQIKAAQGGE